MDYELGFEAEPFAGARAFNEFEAEDTETLEEWQGETPRKSPQRVRWIQEALNKILGLRLKVDGMMGPQTRSAIRSFQTTRGLGADGIVGPKTQAAMNAALGGVQIPPQTNPPYTTPALLTPPASQGTQRTVYGWSQYKRRVEDLPTDQKAILKGIGDAIIASYQPGRQPVQTVQVYGHADQDTPRNAQREQQMSDERAQQVTDWLKAHVGDSIARRIAWDTKGFGATQLKASLENEKSRRKNRRVEIVLHVRAGRPVCPCPPTRSSNLTAWLQTTLNQVLGLSLPVSGIFDPKTRTATRLFQSRNGFASSGEINEGTLAALSAVSLQQCPCDLAKLGCADTHTDNKERRCAGWNNCGEPCLDGKNKYPSCKRDRFTTPFYKDEYGVGPSVNRYTAQTSCLACMSPLKSECHDKPDPYRYYIYASEAVRNNRELIRRERPAKVTILFCVGDQMNRHGLRRFFSYPKDLSGSGNSDCILITVSGIEISRGQNWAVGISDCLIEALFQKNGLSMDWEVQVLAAYSTGYRGLLKTVVEQPCQLSLNAVKRVLFFDCFYRDTSPEPSPKCAPADMLSALTAIRNANSTSQLQVVVYDVANVNTGKALLTNPAAAALKIEWIIVDLLPQHELLLDLLYARILAEGHNSQLIYQSEIPTGYQDLIKLLPPRGILSSVSLPRVLPSRTLSWPLNHKGTGSTGPTQSLADWGRRSDVTQALRRIKGNRERTLAFNLIVGKCLMGWRPPNPNEVLHDQFIPEFGWESLLAD